jgi:hypothetical protein
MSELQVLIVFDCYDSPYISSYRESMEDLIIML